METIDNFVIGVGYDYNDSGARRLESSFGSIQTRALQLGAVVAGAIGARQLTFGFAESADELGKFSQALGVIPGEVAALDVALRKAGGSSGEIFSQLEAIQAIRGNILLGQFTADDAQALGIDPDPIFNATNAVEAYIGAISQLSRFEDGSDRQIEAAEALGLSRSSQLLGSLGEQEIRDQLEQYQQVLGFSQEDAESAARLNDAYLDLTTTLRGISGDVSSELIVPLADGIERLNALLTENREAISSFFSGLLSPIETIQGYLGLTPSEEVDDRQRSGVSRRRQRRDYDAERADQGALEIYNSLVDRSSQIINQVVSPEEDRGVGRRRRSRREKPVVVQAQLSTSVQLDGRQIGETVERVIMQQNAQTLSDLESSEDSD